MRSPRPAQLINACCRRRHCSAWIAPAQAFIAMHWGDGNTAAGAAPSGTALTAGVSDSASRPSASASRQPEREHAAGEDPQRPSCSWRLRAMAGCRRAEAAHAREQLPSLMGVSPLAAATCQPG